jgi:hypothetical protein
MSGRLALSISPEWRALYFPPADREAILPLIPDGHILGVRALARRKWRVWLMTDTLPEHQRKVIWQVDRITNVNGLEACQFAFRKNPTTTDVTVDDEGYIRG